ncbi:4'-phosphopantetheinyl transferase superfamily protein [Niastella caeni]|uniref:4'-phosphopantetheinyl transferase superfamily protein n=1 Tax=Niastella caeni TaxID=2569763 RepID=A0A4S8I4H1_9BACT|nr:4'-phosphopantetheinyl transferase superfamily protein [Niastella caeni]THU41502.1 4'-phosphopantetheinyl transferase superfamily protein [Niastella caeni]
MEEKIKDLIAAFLRVPAEQISYNTVIDRTAVSSSITLHRMYAKLAEEGFIVADYWNIKTFSTLVERINGNGHATSSVIQDVVVNTNAIPVHRHAVAPAVGIDIEEVTAMPRTNDFREDEFYKMNFSPGEIAYCILQPSPYASFAGLFAAKEAIVKADNVNRSRPFNTIVINHDPEGKPTYPGYDISVSHTNDLAIAVAIHTETSLFASEKNVANVQQPSNRSNAKWLFVLSFIISLVALFIALFK